MKVVPAEGCGVLVEVGLGRDLAGQRHHPVLGEAEAGGGGGGRGQAGGGSRRLVPRGRVPEARVQW